MDYITLFEIIMIISSISLVTLVVLFVIWFSKKVARWLNEMGDKEDQGEHIPSFEVEVRGRAVDPPERKLPIDWTFEVGESEVYRHIPMMRWEFVIDAKIFCLMGFWGHHGYVLDFSTKRHNWHSRELKTPRFIKP